MAKFKIQISENPQMTDEQVEAWASEFVHHLANDMRNEDFVRIADQQIYKKREQIAHIQYEIESLKRVRDGLAQEDPKGNIFTCTRP